MMTKKDIIDKVIYYSLIFLIIINPLLVYKYVDYYRANQELWVKFIPLFILFIVLLKIIEGAEIIIIKDTFYFLFLIFLFYLSTSLIYSSNRVISLRFLFIFSCYIFLFLLVINLQIKNKTILLMNVFIVSALFVSIYTIFHYYGLIQYLAEYGPVFSPIGQKNWTSNFLSLVLPSSFVLYLISNKNKEKYFYAFAIIVNYIAILICQSRGIWISIVLSIPIAILLIKMVNLIEIIRGNRKNLIIILLLMSLITVVFSTDNPLNKSRIMVPQRAFSVLDKEDASINVRIILLNSTLKMILKRPLFGFGLGTFNLNYPDYQAIYLKENPGKIKYLSDRNVLEAHNEYIQFGAEIGIIGLILLLSILFYFYKNTWTFLQIKGKECSKDKMLLLGLFLGINIFLIHCLFTFPFHVPFLGASFFMVFGLARFIQIKNQFKNKDNDSKLYFQLHLRKSLRIFSMAGLCLIFVVSTYLFIVKPYLSEVYSFQGQKAYYIEEDLSKSIDYFEKAVQMDPYNGRILLHLGANYLNANILDEALLALDKAKEYYKDKNIYRNIGIYYTQKGNSEKSLEILKRALYLYPQYIKAYNELASLYIYDSEYQKAITQWKKAIDLGLKFREKHIFLYYIGMAYQRMGKTENAYDYFLEALKEAPDDTPIMEDIEKELLKISQSKNVSE